MTVTEALHVEAAPAWRFDWSEGAWIPAVEIRYRSEGSRGRWTKFVVVLALGDSPGPTLAAKNEIAAEYARESR